MIYLPDAMRRLRKKTHQDSPRKDTQTHYPFLLFLTGGNQLTSRPGPQRPPDRNRDGLLDGASRAVGEQDVDHSGMATAGWIGPIVVDDAVDVVGAAPGVRRHHV